MAPAVAVLEELSATLHANDPSTTLLSNYDGAAVAGGAANLASLVAQVSRPVRWDLCMEEHGRMGVTGIIELPPAGTLVGLARRGLKGIPTLALKSPEDLEAARAFVARTHPSSRKNPES